MVISGSLILLTITAYYLNTRLQSICAHLLKESIKKSTNGLYDLRFDELHVNILTGDVTFKHVSLKPYMTIYKHLKLSKQAPAYLVDITLENIYFHQANFLKLYFNKSLHVKSIVAEGPVIEVKSNALNQKKPEKTYQLLPGGTKGIYIDNLILHNASFKYAVNGEPNGAWSIHKLTFKMSNLAIDSASRQDTGYFFFAKDIFLQVANYRYLTKDGLYTIKLAKGSASIGNKLIQLNGLQVIPNYTELQFCRKFKFQHDRYSLKFNQITFKKVNFKQISAEKQLICSSVIFGGGKVDVFMSHEQPPLLVDKSRSYPQLALKRLKIKTKIDSVNIKDIDVSYSEYAPHLGGLGTVSFRNIHGSMFNLTNEPAALQKNQWCNANLTGWLMGRGKIDLQIGFNLTSKNAAFNYQGALKNTDLRILNPVAKPLGMIEIESGFLRQVKFKMSANKHFAKGYVKASYQNLAIKVFKKDIGHELKKHGFMTLLANAAIQSDNPSKGQALRIGRVFFKRPKQASFFNLLWKSVFYGMKESVGLHSDKKLKNINKATKPTRIIKKARLFFEKIKACFR